MRRPLPRWGQGRRAGRDAVPMNGRSCWQPGKGGLFTRGCQPSRGTAGPAISTLANRLPAGVRPPEVGHGKQRGAGVLQDGNRVLREIVSDHE